MAQHESAKVVEYRRTLHEAAKGGRDTGDQHQQELEGRAAKLGAEVQHEHSKAAPHRGAPIRNPRSV